MVDVAMVVLSERPTDGRATLQMTAFPPQPLIVGEPLGPINYLCGACSFVIMQGLREASQVIGGAFCCPRCSKWNEPRT